MEGYQPPLLSLHDMLNLSDDEEDSPDAWSQNPYSISNFFEPIAKATGGGDVSVTGSGGGAASGSGNGQFSGATNSTYGTGYYDDPFADVGIGVGNGFQTQQHVGREQQVTNIKGEAFPGEGRGGFVGYEEAAQNDSEDEFPCLDMFEEAAVTSEMKDEPELEPPRLELEEPSVMTLVDSEPEAILPHLGSELASPVVASPRKSRKDIPMEMGPPELTKAPPQLTKRPTLREVTVDDLEEVKAKAKRLAQQKCRDAAISQLNALILSLKRYSNQLEDFLTNEGDMILEHYSAKTLLRGIMPEINESLNKTHPFYEAHTITQILINRARGETPLSKLPPRKPYLWKGSDLLLLQKTILQSVIHQREFFLYCRYTDILTQMGFDLDDLDRLNKCLTMEAELGMLKLILNEHEFYSKLKGNLKKPIQKMVITKDFKGSGIPRVCVYPSPEQLVADKWKALIEIRRRTVLSAIEHKDINWLYVLKELSEKNPRLNKVDEAACKLTYDHLLSFRYNNAPWHVSELQTLQNLREKQPNASWAEIAESLNTNRSPFSCFVKYKLHCVYNPKSLNRIPRETLETVKDCFEQCLGNASQVDFMLRRVLKKHQHQLWITPSRLLDLSMKTCNPRLRKGVFTPVEDALLLVLLEKYRSYFLENNGALDPIGYAFPWRYKTTLRMRLQTLFSKVYSTKWTLEDDKLLLSLRDKYGPKYKIIQRAFPLKDRKQCSFRYVYLQKILKTTTLEDYHRFYMHRQSGLKISKLHKTAIFLDMTIRSKLAGNGRFVREIDLEFLKLRRRPTESNLECYLMTFPASLMSKALNRLTDCLDHIAKKYKEIPTPEKGSNMAIMLQGFDRRKFDVTCPISIGSALHGRNATLVPEHSIQDMTEFEKEIYEAYKFFSARSTTKLTTKRTYIPTLDILRKIRSVSRITMPPVQAPKPGEPSVVLTIKSELHDEQEKEREEQELLQELEELKKGGRRKGSKRKKTQYKESRKRAAMLRWQNQRAAEAQNDEEVVIDDEIESIPSVATYGSSSAAGSPSCWDVMSPGTPATPGSVTSNATTTDSESLTGLAPFMRKTMLGMISDHAYILPMESPSELSALSLPELFAKGGVKVRRSARSKPENT